MQRMKNIKIWIGLLYLILLLIFSLFYTTKSISKNNQVEINFTKEIACIDGNLINLTEPNVESIKKNLTYIRAEADSLALEFRFHSKEIHNNFLNNNDFSNNLLNSSLVSLFLLSSTIFLKNKFYNC